MDTIIEITDLIFTYPDGKLALDGINLRINTGERVALIGANGAGKSTLLFHLNGILSGRGRIVIDGLELNPANTKRIRALTGLVFQHPDDQLFSPTVFEDVAYGPIYQGFDKLAVQEKVTQALNAVNMAAYSARNPYHLSEGEKKRVAIAAVLSMQPKILVLDEPSAGLDPRSRRELIELLGGLPLTLLFATHDLDMARQLSTRTILLHEGRIVADGRTEAILSDSKLLYAHNLA